jgi:hypothetical protein
MDLKQNKWKGEEIKQRKFQLIFGLHAHMCCVSSNLNRKSENVRGHNTSEGSHLTQKSARSDSTLRIDVHKKSLTHLFAWRPAVALTLHYIQRHIYDCNVTPLFGRLEVAKMFFLGCSPGFLYIIHPCEPFPSTEVIQGECGLYRQTVLQWVWHLWLYCHEERTLLLHCDRDSAPSSNQSSI